MRTSLFMLVTAMLALVGLSPLAMPASAAPAANSLAALKSRYSDAASQYARIGAISIRYKDEGGGDRKGRSDEAIVLLHGSYGSLDGYDDLARELARDHRVIRFDMPGMGLSEGQVQGGEAATLYGDVVLETLLEKLGVDQVVLVGTSSGGVIGAYYAARHPDRVRALVLANVPSDPVDNANVPRSPALRAEFERAEKTGVRDARYWQVYLAWLQGRPERLRPASVARYEAMNRREDKARSAWRSTQQVPDVYVTLARIAKPVLLVWGRNDFVLPLHTMHDLEARLAAASVSTIVLDDVGHYPPLEVPERFARILRTYLENVASGS